MIKQNKIIIILLLLLLLSKKTYAINNNMETIVIENIDNTETRIKTNESEIVLKKNNELKINYNLETLIYLDDVIGFTYTSNSNKKLETGKINIVKGNERKEDNKLIIEDGKLLIETNLGNFEIEKGKIIFISNSNSIFQIEKGFVTNLKNYKSTDITENKKENKEKELTQLDIYKQNQTILKEIQKIYQIINDQNTQKESQIKLLDRVEQLENDLVFNQKQPNLQQFDYPNSDISNETVTDENTDISNEIKKTGNLEMNILEPKNISDIYVDIALKDENKEVITFYLSKHNEYKCSLNLEIGDYIIQDVYFLDHNSKGKYYFEHNDLIKVLEQQTVFFEIKPVSIFDEEQEEDIEKLKTEEITEEKIEEEPKEKSKTGQIIFIIITLISIIGFILWKTGILKKIFLNVFR